MEILGTSLGELDEFVELVKHNPIGAIGFHTRVNDIKSFEKPWIFVYAQLDGFGGMDAIDAERIVAYYDGRAEIVDTSFYAPTENGACDIYIAPMNNPVIWKDPRGNVFAVTEADRSVICFPDFPHKIDGRPGFCQTYATFVNEMFEDASRIGVARLTQKLLDAVDDSVVVKRLDVVFDVDLYIETAAGILRTTEMRLEKVWSRKVDQLEQAVVNARTDSADEIMGILAAVNGYGFRMIAADKFVHDEKIVCDRAKHGDSIYEMDEEMWIEELVVQVSSSLEMVSAYCKDSWHPNCDDGDDAVCIGDFEGHHVREIGDLVNALMLPNLDSCYGSWNDHKGEMVGSSMWRA